jgi:hypothetical protein
MLIDLDTVAEALRPLTTAEKDAAWSETMHYSPEQAGAMLRMAPSTVTKIRDRAGELLRGAGISWRRSILEENGLALGREAAAARTSECVSAKAFMDVIDGRSTWSGREAIELHINTCWHCIDHYCRLCEIPLFLRP